MSQSGDVLERFVEALLQEITVTRPEYLTGPFTVAEIYQDLIPYRSHRDLIGVEMNGDYEDALIRLLSGEGDYLLLDSAVAQQEMQKELESPNPNTALFREFAAVGVRLHSRLAAQTSGLGPEPSAEVSEAYPSDPEVAGARDIQPEAEAEADVELELEPEPELEPDLEMEPEAEVELALDAGVELELEAEQLAPEESREETPPKAAEVGAGRQSEPAATTIGETEPVEVLKPEPGRSSGDGVVGHIETASALPTAASPPLASFEEPAPDETASKDAETTSTDAETASRDAETTSTDAASTDAEPGDALTVCHWCREALPVRDSINFCPFCGSDLRPSPCRECGEAMEAQWHFCVSCGTDIRG